MNSNLSHGPKSYKTDQIEFCGLSLNHSISRLECSNEMGQKPWYWGLNVFVKNICNHEFNYGLVILISLIWLVRFYWHTLYRRLQIHCQKNVIGSRTNNKLVLYLYTVYLNTLKIEENVSIGLKMYNNQEIHRNLCNKSNTKTILINNQGINLSIPTWSCRYTYYCL